MKLCCGVSTLAPPLPPRRWLVVGPPASGKTTFILRRLGEAPRAEPWTHAADMAALIGAPQQREGLHTQAIATRFMESPAEFARVDSLPRLWASLAPRWRERNRAGGPRLSEQLPYFITDWFGTGPEAPFRRYTPHARPVTRVVRETKVVEARGFVLVDAQAVFFCVNPCEYDWVDEFDKPRLAASMALYEEIAKAYPDAARTLVFTHWDVFRAKILESKCEFDVVLEGSPDARGRAALFNMAARFGARHYMVVDTVRDTLLHEGKGGAVEQHGERLDVAPT